MWDSLPSAAVHIRSGAVRPLAVSTAQRSAAFPEIPTLTELGFPNVVTTNWFGLAGPAAVPDAVVAAFYAQLQRALASEAVRTRYASIGVDPGGNSPEEAQRYVLAEMDRWAEVVRATGVTLD